MTINEAGDILDMVLESDVALENNRYSGTGEYIKENLKSVSINYRYDGKISKTPVFVVYLNFGYTGNHNTRTVAISIEEEMAFKLFDAGRLWLDHLNVRTIKKLKI